MNNLLLKFMWFVLTVIPITAYGLFVVFFGDELQYQNFEKLQKKIWWWNK